MTLLLSLFLITSPPLIDYDPNYCYEVTEELIVAVKYGVITQKEAELFSLRCPRNR